MANPKTRALTATICFAIAGIYFLYRAPITAELLLQLIFYSVLVLNAFFSVWFYSAIQPRDVSQLVIDAILVILFLALAVSLGRPVAFTFAALCLFIAATAKYVLMLELIPHNALLKRKILIDLQGAALCAVVLAATLAGYELAGAWALAVLFSIANIYYMLIHPMYRL